MNSKALVILASPGISNAILYNHLAARFEVLRVIIERRLSRVAVFSKRRKRLGMGPAMGQAAFRIAIAPMLEIISRKRNRQIALENGLNTTPIPPNLITKVESVNADAAVALLREHQPAVVIVNGTRILSREVLRSVPAKFVNLHAGITPRYRGVHGAYWALVEGRTDLCGVTLHQLDEGIDTGPVLAQTKITPTESDNFATYPTLQLAAYLPLLDSVLPILLEGGQPPIIASAEPSKLWTHPTAAQYIRNRARGVK